MTRQDLAGSLILTAVLGALIKGGVALAGHSIAWILALVVAAVVVYGGILIIDGNWID